MGVPAKGLLTVGQVVVLAFPYSDLSDYKLRPVILIADAGKGDWLTAQITSNPYGDPGAVPLTDDDFIEGGLALASFVRPAKLFTAHFSIITGRTGALKAGALEQFASASSMSSAVGQSSVSHCPKSRPPHIARSRRSIC